MRELVKEKIEELQDTNEIMAELSMDIEEANESWKF